MRGSESPRATGIASDSGDVVRSTDPFKLGTDKQRPWLILTDERHPFAEVAL
ncbi:MAG: hypothetical protein IH933_17245 [Euryarchaeota archaeon]|jgi:hypothetical protein|nr:hypothetical protein [Euryarchaeota archaeon]